jgi:hypothetical protein
MIRTESPNPRQFSHGVAAIALATAILFVALFLRASSITFVESPTAPQLMAKESEGLLRVAAEHLSKLQGGASIGGFPGFEPPDDERYKRIVKNASYTGEEANTWLKEIINYLRQLIKLYPGKTLAEILGRHGLSEAEIKSFTDALRLAYTNAVRLSNDGVRAETITALQELLPALGVSLP